MNKLRLGLALIILSGVPWIALLAIPFLKPLSVQTIVAGSLLISAEIIFWSGIALTGHDAWQIIRAHGWRRAPSKMIRSLRSGTID